MDIKIEKKQLRRESAKRYVKYGVIIASVIAVVAILIASMGKDINRNDIIIGTVDEGSLDITVPASGRVVPAYEEIITSPVSSRVLKVFAQAGDSVKAGQPLLEIDLRQEETDFDKLVDRRNMQRQELTQLELSHRTLLSDLEMQIEVSEMEVNRLKIEVENERRLDSIGSGTGERVRQAETAWQSAVLQLRQLRTKLANERKRTVAAEGVQKLNVSSIDKDIALAQRTLQLGQIPAPLDGVLTFISTDLGAPVGAGEKVAVVSDLSSFRIDAEIPEGSSGRVTVGSPVTVRIGSGQLQGTVSNITPQAKGGVVSFVVRLDDPRNSRLRSGLRAELYVAYGYKDKVTRIPVGKFFKGPGEYQLFVLDGENKLVKRGVKLGDSNREFAEVISGLNPGDRVVVSDMSKYQNDGSLNIK